MALRSLDDAKQHYIHFLNPTLPSPGSCYAPFTYPHASELTSAPSRVWCASTNSGPGSHPFSHTGHSEWYSYHFPELVKIVNDNTAFARLAKLIGRRTSLNADSQEMLEEVVMDTAKAQQIIEASKTSMGKLSQLHRAIPCCRFRTYL